VAESEGIRLEPAMGPLKGRTVSNVVVTVP
jgi:hypothetical protein